MRKRPSTWQPPSSSCSPDLPASLAAWMAASVVTPPAACLASWRLECLCNRVTCCCCSRFAGLAQGAGRRLRGDQGGAGAAAALRGGRAPPVLPRQAAGRRAAVQLDEVSPLARLKAAQEKELRGSDTEPRARRPAAVQKSCRSPDALSRTPQVPGVHGGQGRHGRHHRAVRALPGANRQLRRCVTSRAAARPRRP